MASLQTVDQLEKDQADSKLSQRLAALASMDGDQLRREWQRLYRTNTPKRMKHDLLILAISWKVQEKAYGGLSASSKRKLVELGDELQATDSLVDRNLA